jgi:hypothetical protein
MTLTAGSALYKAFAQSLSQGLRPHTCNCYCFDGSMLSLNLWLTKAVRVELDPVEFLELQSPSHALGRTPLRQSFRLNAC